MILFHPKTDPEVMMTTDHDLLRLQRALARMQGRTHSPRYPVVRAIKVGRFWRAEFRNPGNPAEYLTVQAAGENAEFFTRERALESAWTHYSEAKQDMSPRGTTITH